VAEYEAILKQREKIEEGYLRLTEARRENENLNRKLGLLVELREQKERLEKIIQQGNAKLMTDHAVLQSRLEELEKQVQRMPQLKAELSEAQAELVRLTAEEAELVIRQKKGRKYRRQ